MMIATLQSELSQLCVAGLCCEVEDYFSLVSIRWDSLGASPSLGGAKYPPPSHNTPLTHLMMPHEGLQQRLLGRVCGTQD